MFTEIIKPKAALPGAVAERLADNIEQVTAQNEYCNCAFSGGNSPASMLQLLAEYPCTWGRVHILLVDERWTEVPEQQNETLIRAFVNATATEGPTYTPLLVDKDFDTNLAIINHTAKSLSGPPDILVLGMGLDGHTASLFPTAPEYPLAMSSTEHYVKVTPSNAPYVRISMSFDWIIQARNIYLYIPGQEKFARFQELIHSPTAISPIKNLVSTVPEKITVCSSKD